MTQDAKIGRQFHSSPSIVVADAIGDSTPIDLRNFAGGVLVAPAGLTGTHTLTFFVAATDDGTYTQLYDGGGTPAEIEKGIEASQAIKLPDELFAAGFLKVVSDTADFTATIHLKG